MTHADTGDFPDDQALILAACLAHESARDDRILNDPQAARLAGGRGQDLFTATAGPEQAFIAALHVAATDELVQWTILDRRVHTTVTLGAGLDARPYRLGLPSDLRWVELDDDALVTYKQLRLAHVQPTCRVERVALDLSDGLQRHDVLHRLVSDVTRGLLVTEHTTGALPPMALSELTADLPAGLKWWILDTPSSDPGPVNDLPADQWQIANRLDVRAEALRLAPKRLEQLESDAAPQRGPAGLGAVWLLRRTTVRGRPRS